MITTLGAICLGLLYLSVTERRFDIRVWVPRPFTRRKPAGEV